MRDLIGILYYALVWPLRSIGGQLVDRALVATGIYWQPPTGPARRRGR